MSIAICSNRTLLRLAFLLPVVFPLVLNSPAQAQSICSVAVSDALPEEIQYIIRLTDNDFKVREDAAHWLTKNGIAAWDWLYRARQSSDPEVSRIAERLLKQIPYEHELGRFVPSLVNYRSANFSNRARMIIRLGSSPGSEEQTALALITRFESDELLSRNAAMELITGGWQPISNLADLVKTSPRVASHWLRVHAETSNAPQNFVQRWQSAIEHLATDPVAKQQPTATRRMMQWHAEQLMLRREDELVEWTVRNIVNNVDEQPVDAIEIFDWLLLYRQYDGCDQLVGLFPELMHVDSRLIYRRAELARLRGQLLQANEIASTVAHVDASDHLMRLQSAINLQLAGLHHWSAEELSSIVNDENTQTSVRIQACSLLAELQYQAHQFETASKTLATALENRHDKGDSAVTLLNDDLHTRFHLFSHLASVENGDWQAAEKHLLDGLEAAPNDSDLLIAMFRFSGADLSPKSASQWRQMTSELITLALQQHVDQIEAIRVGFDKDARQSRLRREGLVSELNAFAWLASQTGNSLDTAEEFAREAAELSPDNGHVLDTLAACLFSQAKLDEAVACKQRALKQAPWSRQIRDGLVQYRQAMMLAELPELFR